MIRNKDNYKNAYDYIKNQLFLYDYNNAEHLHILKMKFWALDAEILPNENIEDKDVNNPVDHKKDLENELVFLDRYIRTKDKLLNKYEETYNSLVRSRKSQQRVFLSQKNPITGKRNEAWELDYLRRPTRLTVSEVETLYRIYKEKEKNKELSNADEIISKLADNTVNDKVLYQQIAIDNTKSPAEQKEDIFNAGVIEKGKEDDSFVKEMNRAHEEIISIIKEIMPELPKPPEQETDDEGNVISSETWTNSQIVLVNFPTIREYVEAKAGSSSHKGVIIESLGTGRI